MKLSNVPDCFFEENRAFIVNDYLNFGFCIDPKAALHLCNFDEMSVQLAKYALNIYFKSAIQQFQSHGDRTTLGT